VPEQEQTLTSWFADCPFALVAFSGGVDSSLVAYLARLHMGDARMMAVISASPSLKLSDLDAGKQFCMEHDIPLKIIETEELKNPNYAANPANRCYFCKHTLYTELQVLAKRKAPCWILNGTNTDDLGDYRPGLQAASEFEVHSPLSACGLNKEAVRTMARSLELVCWDKPASPCMSSRIPYGQEVTLKKLRQIEAGEALVMKLGFPIVRLRHHGTKAVIEIPPEDIPRLKLQERTLTQQLSILGFAETEIDDEGFVSGKLNRVLP
jgi:pyridinium-3,5-biscarboxylic acid mononucleotide sulfurtransferase